MNIVSVYGEREWLGGGEIREAISAGLEQIKRCGLNVGAGKIKIAQVRREDWAESWKRHFKAIEIGDALLVKPSWIKRKPRKGQAVVVLDPGLSFGTGQHPTTSFCLHQLVAAAGRPPQISNQAENAVLCRAGAAPSFLDLGTGSGILAIAAAKLGYAPICALDFDPESVRVARANARVNRVAPQLKITHGDVTKLPLTPARQYALVCANLISNLLIAERRRIVGQLKPGGTLVLAGILKIEFALVQNAFEALGLKLAAAKSEKEWRSGSFCFGARPSPGAARRGLVRH